MKYVLKGIICSLIMTISINIIYTNVLNLKSTLYDKVPSEEYYVYSKVLGHTYKETKDYKLKKYIDIAILIMEGENKNPTKNQINKYLNVFDEKSGAWCTEFVVWSLLEADKKMGTNYVNKIYPKRQSGYIAANWYNRHKRLHTEKDYIPKRGDMMFFIHYGSIIDHTAFVTGVKEIDGELYVMTIEGNIPSHKNKGIKERTLKLTDRTIYGYGSYE